MSGMFDNSGQKNIFQQVADADAAKADKEEAANTAAMTSQQSLVNAELGNSRPGGRASALLTGAQGLFDKPKTASSVLLGS